MKTLLRSACVAVLVLLLAATASPAVAKGPTDVRVSGPGVDTWLGYQHGSGAVDLGQLSEASRLYDVLGDSVLAKDPGLDRGQLGPRYVLEWTAGGAEMYVQHAYPFAEGGAWVRFLPTESGWGTGKTGWVRTPALTDQLVALGATRETPEPSTAAMAATPDVTTTPGGPDATESSGRTPYDVIVPAGLALVVVLATVVLIVRRRQLSR